MTPFEISADTRRREKSNSSLLSLSTTVCAGPSLIHCLITVLLIGQPLHIARVIPASRSKWDAVVNLVAVTGTFGTSGARTGVTSAEVTDGS
jgi:hypothetical protein